MNPGLIATVMGAVVGLIGLPGLLAPEKTLGVYNRLYRNVLAARALTLIDMVWVGILLLDTFWGGYEPYKRWTYVAVPVAILLICVYVDDLLMPRALGGLFLLVPAPVLSVFRWEASTFRYVLIVFCYLLVIAGFALIMNPFMYRKALECVGKSTARFRTTGAVVTAFGAVVVALGLLVF